jgi:hypothetical protein
MRNVEKKKKKKKTNLFRMGFTQIGFYAGCGFEMVGPSDVVHGQEEWFEMKIDLGAST